MKTEQPTLIDMLSRQMGYMTERQSIIAQNIANIDTPKYRSQDLQKVDFASMAAAESGKLEMRATSEKHLHGTLAAAGHFATVTERNTFETTPTGNNVVLEEQMAKISDTGAQFQIASSLFHKFTQLYRNAVGNR